MNPVAILTRNCLDLTIKCVESIRNQSIPTSIVVYDNGSTDGTWAWLRKNLRDGDMVFGVAENRGVSEGWNVVIPRTLKTSPHVLVINNDTVLPPWLYEILLTYDPPMVTGVAVGHMPQELPQPMPLVPHPDFSCFLMRKECWDRVGEFDTEMKFYVQDCDYHVRAHRLGVPLMKANVPYYHANSSTMRNASPRERAEIAEQALKDREVFRGKYGCIPGTPEYEALFSNG